MKRNIVIYGSYGFTGNLIAEIAARKGLPVVLSGRNREKLESQGERLNLPVKQASVESPEELDELLVDADVVIHCAGPFVHTWKAMAEACLRNQCHYLDITGEIPVFESIKVMNQRFLKQNVMAMPGVGFDVVPTDCMAAYLHQFMPDARYLELAFMGLGGGISQGTARTMIQNLGHGGLIRKDGHLIRVKTAHRKKKINFGDKTSMVVTIPWGDVSTAYATTGIENITVYMAASRGMIRGMKLSNYFGALMRNRWFRNALEKRIKRGAKGPGKRERTDGVSYIWGMVQNDQGETKESVFKTKEGYQLTAETALIITEKVTSGNFVPGFQTPAKVYGDKLVFEIEKTEWIFR